MQRKSRYLIAVDTGGTFTDLAVYDARTSKTFFGKTLTNYEDLVAGVIECLRDAGTDLSGARLLKHGTTHVINGFIQRTGARVALVTTVGFRDILEIARGSRPVPFDLGYRRAPPLVTRDLCFEVGERITCDGDVERPLDVTALERLIPELRRCGVESIAISFVNSYRNSTHERKAKEILQRLLPNLFVTTGSELSMEWGEYERTSTVAANAYVGHRMRSYIRDFEKKLRERDFSGSLYMMASNGGVMSGSQAIAHPVALLESGPVGGCIGTGAYASALKLDRLIAFDMGGTTAKCALVEHGRFDVQTTYYVGGYEHGFPIRAPVLDIVEVGAGGGSIGWLDSQGRLKLGPRSAGSEPGPICFGRGGTEPTITDASLVLGRIGSENFLNGRLALNRERAAHAIEQQLAAPLGYSGSAGVDQVAHGLLELAVVAMTAAIKEITIQRGRDVRDFALCAFGGGGPMFGAQLARELGIPTVIVPPNPGAFSSLGMLVANARRDFMRIFIQALSDESLTRAMGVVAEIEEEAREAARSEFDVSVLTFEREVELRYRGQKHTVRVRLPENPTAASMLAGFEAGYRSRYGRVHPELVAEMIALRVGALVPMPQPDLSQLSESKAYGETRPTRRRSVYFAEAGKRVDTPIFDRSALPVGFELNGPAIIEEYSATTVLGPPDRLLVGTLGELRITCARP
ncbi:MAG: hydantoinase/oxoprolinase family protein [Bradyrhizobiaceae bacterium]|nr:hydantoinase/oxoprolinase family protein [Bradyrhizobiaceae bacterium]